jgi:hypothetical protein
MAHRNGKGHGAEGVDEKIEVGEKPEVGGQKNELQYNLLRR